MSLVLTILSVLALWTFLGVLFVGILLIRKTLESVRLYLEKTATGVRAIEQQTAFVRSRARGVDDSLKRTSEALSASALRFEELK